MTEAIREEPVDPSRKQRERALKLLRENPQILQRLGESIINERRYGRLGVFPFLFPLYLHSLINAKLKGSFLYEGLDRSGKIATTKELTGYAKEGWIIIESSRSAVHPSQSKIRLGEGGVRIVEDVLWNESKRIAGLVPAELREIHTLLSDLENI